MTGWNGPGRNTTDEPGRRDEARLAGISSTAGMSSTRVPRWKRILDVAIVLIVVPLLLPLVVLLALFIKLTSRGPLLFKQERVGHLGQRFVMFKFRTMAIGTDKGVHERHVADLISSNQPMTKLDAQGDTRLISLGYFFRAAGLDELPQLLNVLRGEMSIVGPRPCVACEFERYLPWQRERFNTLPGLTGLWQVSGKNRLTFLEMVDCDIRYVRTKSLLLDLKIIARTVPALINELRNARRRADPPASKPPEQAVAPRHAQAYAADACQPNEAQKL